MLCVLDLDDAVCLLLILDEHRVPWLEEVLYVTPDHLYALFAREVRQFIFQIMIS